MVAGLEGEEFPAEDAWIDGEGRGREGGRRGGFGEIGRSVFWGEKYSRRGRKELLLTMMGRDSVGLKFEKSSVVMLWVCRMV